MKNNRVETANAVSTSLKRQIILPARPSQIRIIALA